MGSARGWNALLLLASASVLVQAAACSNLGYFPANAQLPKLDMDKYDDATNLRDFDMPMQGLWGHPARFLPVNHTKARFLATPLFAGPWAAQALLRCLTKKGGRGGRTSQATCPRMSSEHQASRRGFLSLAGAALLSLGGGGAARADGELPKSSIKNMMQEAEAEKKRKAEMAASAPQRPTELRNEKQCLTWNGEKKCFTCVEECERYRSLNPGVDCVKQCTIEYGAAKPTDEDSIGFKEFMADLEKGSIAKVDFYGPSGDKAYATYKEGKYIRIGEGFPIEIGNEASSPMLVVRLLQQKSVAYKFHFLDNIKYQKMGK